MTSRLPRIWTAAEAAEHLRITSRALIKIAKATGNCSVQGRNVILSEADINAVWESMRCPLNSSSARLVTFNEAAASYIEQGGDGRFILYVRKTDGAHCGLAVHFMNCRLNTINQGTLDDAAHTLYPNASPETLNRQCYTRSLQSGIMRLATVGRTCASGAARAS
ncbi:hypothetical protein [Microvirga terricola]|uniref:Helix-turn-helix domain-containing protein n=1 Tax=Microvirga terricola TaxID=2719797 RepID=A0ABX0V872_9HYPH|nr:hypothetical protein [Microvirga terricola]NIX75892.1 hypothetical protein [Microvirga terricola]